MYNTILLVWYSWIPALLCHVYYIQGKINQLLNFIKSLSNHCMVIDHFRHFIQTFELPVTVNEIQEYRSLCLLMPYKILKKLQKVSSEREICLA